MSSAATKRRARTAAVITTALLATALGGCLDHYRIDGPTAAMLNDPSKRHAIGYSASSEALHVEVAGDGGGLSANQTTDVIRFLDRYKSEAHGPLRILAPGTPRGHMSVARSYREIEDIVDRAGIPPEAVLRERIRVRGPDAAAVRLIYERPVAQPPDCGNWPDDMGRIDRDKLPYENFGCATQRNLALTVANARDLQVPQEETPRSSERRSVTWTKYVGASPTGSSSGGSGSSGGSPAAGGAPSASGATK
ncbi:MAG: CpaD family pilus assembly protein [Hyphomicrobiaceae bacterium]|nr:CpaD family pilus assembly protein [Hyphomicrobiaceae bacterium]